MNIVFIVNNKNNRLAKVLPKLEPYCQEMLDGHVRFLYTLRKKHAIELAKKPRKSAVIISSLLGAMAPCTR